MSDKQPLPTFSSICKSKPIYNYTITEQEIKSLQHNVSIIGGCDVVAGFLVAILVLVIIWVLNDGDDWKKITTFSIVGLLLVFVVHLSIETSSNSKEIWDNVKQVSEVICEKK
ncbi:hypothetical protein [Bartonella gabonensis]|uniref:hypothetical protein n=1 Tax=Bartonella gabonensis TaxID=2699889 RepID=UPI00158E9C9D|nr:hypothetical protein [Bartonella gabonensis]